MSLTCVYHRKEGMKVVTMDEEISLLEGGEWFSHPSLTNNGENYEKQIRRSKRGRRSKTELTPEEIGSGA